MRVLIIYQIRDNKERNTVLEYIYSFEKYSKGVHFHYLNVFKSIPIYMLLFHYDAIILHYTFLGNERFLDEEEPWLRKTKLLKWLRGYKIAMPQDEYDHTDRNCMLFKNCNVQSIYTCFTRKEDIELAYPFDKTGVRNFFNVFTGYVDENVLPELKNKTKPYRERPIDIGYRARKLPANFGKHGQLKIELVEFFSEILKGYDLIYDLSDTSTGSNNKTQVKLGKDWYEFLLSCKAFLGCEGGSSLLDSKGAISRKVNNYVKEYPDASFAEIEKNCFPGLDYNISCFAVSPRHFEAAMCKTLQILVEGEYGGALVPWRHYIPLKKDFSNYKEVLDILKNEEKCQEIIDIAYEEVVLSGKYTYRQFVENVIVDIQTNVKKNRKAGFLYNLFGRILNYRNKNYWRIQDLLDRFHRAYSWRYEKYLQPLLFRMNNKKGRIV